jgi:excisionase family DNA binding protein
MAQKYYNVKETAKMLGMPEAEVKQMLERRELHGYRDGADWKFKAEEIEQLVSKRAAEAQAADEGDVLLSEVELGHSDPGLSGTVIGTEKGKTAADSDIRLAQSDVKLAGSRLDLGEERKAPAGAAKDDVAAKVSQFEDLDLTLDQDLTIEDSTLGPPAKPKPGDSVVDLSGKKLEDDELVLGGSGTGSDITIGGDSGISLVDPADSGLSLESPLNLTPPGEESLELGEDDLLGVSPDAGSGAPLKSEDDFQLTPMEEGADADDSESGSQVIALDTAGEGDEAATMLASAGSVAAMLDEDLSTEAGLGLGPEPMLGAGLQPQGALALETPLEPAAVALPEAPYSVWNVVSLVLCSLVLILIGMMMYDLLRNMWGWEGAHQVNSALMDWILGWFEK